MSDNPLVNRAKSNNVKRLDEETSVKGNDEETSVKGNDANTKKNKGSVEKPVKKVKKNELIESIKISVRKERKRINVSMDEDIFYKLITISNGRSVSAVMEKILVDAVKDYEIDEDVVATYIETMSRKGQKNK